MTVTSGRADTAAATTITARPQAWPANDMSEAVEKIRDRPASRLMRSNEGAMRDGRQAGPSSSILTVRPTAPATATSASVGSNTADGSTTSSR